MKKIYRLLGTEDYYMIFTSNLFPIYQNDYDIDEVYPGYKVGIYGSSNIEEFLDYFEKEYGIPKGERNNFREELLNASEKGIELKIILEDYPNFRTETYNKEEEKEKFRKAGKKFGYELRDEILKK